jgi:hypothetical protein
MPRVSFKQALQELPVVFVFHHLHELLEEKRSVACPSWENEGLLTCLQNMKQWWSTRESTRSTS